MAVCWPLLRMVNTRPAMATTAPAALPIPRGVLSHDGAAAWPQPNHMIAKKPSIIAASPRARPRPGPDPDRQRQRPGTPSRHEDINVVWVEFALIAADLLALSQSMLLTSEPELYRAEPKTLRVRVAPFSLDDLEQLYAMRISLACLAVRLTVQDLLSTDIEAMAADMTSMRAASASFDYDAWSPPHIRLHRTVTQCAGTRLRRTLDQLSEAAERYRFSYTTQVPRAWEQGLIEAPGVCGQVRGAGSSSAAESLATHYGRVAVAAVGLLAPEREPTQIRAALRTELGLV